MESRIAKNTTDNVAFLDVTGTGMANEGHLRQFHATKKTLH